jgi:hypothetical protein
VVLGLLKRIITMIIVKQYDCEMKFLKIRRIGKQISREEHSNSALLHLNCSSYKEKVQIKRQIIHILRLSVLPPPPYPRRPKLIIFTALKTKLKASFGRGNIDLGFLGIHQNSQ